MYVTDLMFKQQNGMHYCFAFHYKLHSC